MKKTIAMLLVILASGALFAGMNNFYFNFSTVGPDKYSDGTVVRNGESYALVWTPNGEAFAGFDSKDKAKGNSKLVLNAPVAKDGCCPNILFQIDEEYYNKNFSGGSFAVYLLDTRKFKVEEVAVLGGTQKRILLDENGNKEVASVGGAVIGYVAVAANVTTKSAESVKDAAKSSLVRADGEKAKLKDMKIVGDNVYLFLENASPDFAYSTKSSETPNGNFVADGNPVYGEGEGKETILITPKKGNAGFFAFGAE